MVQQLEETIDKRIAEAEQKQGAVESSGHYDVLTPLVEGAEAAQEAMEKARATQQKNLKDGLNQGKKRESAEQWLQQKREQVKQFTEEATQAVESRSAASKAFEDFKIARSSLAFLRGCEEAGEAEAGSPMRSEQA